MTTIIYLCGIHSFAFAIFHLSFWKIFNWKEDLKTSSVTTRIIVQIANLRLVHIFIWTGIICFLFPDELQTTKLGNAFLIGMSLFWVGRFIENYIFSRYRSLMISILKIMFLIGAALYAAPVLYKM